MTDTETVQAKTRRRWPWVAAVVVVALAGGVAWRVFASSETVEGFVTVHGCERISGQGATVIVTGDGGKELDRSRLGERTHEEPHLTAGAHVDCEYRFDLDIPKGHDLYTVSIGDWGDRSYEWDELTPSFRMTIQ